MNENIIWTPDRRALAIASCQKWRGTPHKNRVAEIGVGIDCIKFVHEILVDSHIIDRQEFSNYPIQEGMFGKSDKLKNALAMALYAEPFPIETHQFGDIAVFKNGMMAGHVGFLDDTHVWHSLAGKIVTKTQFNLWAHDMDFLLRINQLGLKNPAQHAIDETK